MSILKKIIRSLRNLIKGRRSSSCEKVHSKKRLSSLKKKRIPTQSRKKSKNKPNVLKKEEVVGEITHFFSRIQVVVIKMTKAEIVVGDRLRIQGKATNFIQKVRSLQIESVDVKKARKGQLVGLKVESQAKVGDKVFKI